MIGIVVKIVADQWHLSTTQISLLSSTTLAASAVGVDRSRSDHMSSHIIVGIDGSAHSLNAYHWALDESRRREAELTAVFAWETPLIGIPGAFDREELEDCAQKFLNEQLDARPTETGGVTSTASSPRAIRAQA